MSTSALLINFLLLVLSKLIFGAPDVAVMPKRPILLPPEPQIPPYPNCETMKCTDENCESYLVSNDDECVRVRGPCDQRIRNCIRQQEGKELMWSVLDCCEKPKECGTKVCPAIYDPVCVTNDKDPRYTMPSECMIPIIDCEQGTKSTIVYPGECKEDQILHCKQHY